MASPQPDAGGAPIPAPPSLAALREKRKSLSDIRDLVHLSPQLLDEQAGDVHTGLVMPAYKLLVTEVSDACGSAWDERDRQRLRSTWDMIARKWPAYQQALEELETARKRGSTQVPAVRRLETPRADYIGALAGFCQELSGVLDKFFPLRRPPAKAG